MNKKVLSASFAQYLKNKKKAEKMFEGIIGKIQQKLEGGQSDKRLIYIQDGRSNVASDVHRSLMDSGIKVLKSSSVLPKENQDVQNLLF